MSDNKKALSINLLVEELSVVTEWHTLGLYLGLTENEIKEIEQDHDGTARRRIAVLNKWLKKETDPSWLIVISALEKMSETSLANLLRKKYEKPATCDAESTDNPSVSKQVVLKINKKEILVSELEDIENEYLSLIVETESAMETCNASQRKLKRFSKFYTSVRVTTVEELFDHLEQYCFLDYALLRKVISFFLKDRAAFLVSEFDAYIRHLEEFKSSTTIRQFMESIEKAQKQLTTTTGGVETCTVCLRLVGGWLDKTMADLDELLKELFQDKKSVLSHIQIVRGSIVVTYSAPQLKAELLKSIAKQVKLSLSQVGVYSIQIADTVVKVNMQNDPFISFELSLYKAIFCADITLLKLLLRINTDPNKIEIQDISSLIAAIIIKVDLQQMHSIVDLLLKADADPNLQLKDGVTPLHMACQSGYIDIVRLLIQANANTNLRLLSNGCSALHVASLRGHSDVVRILLDAKANPSLQADNGSTPLYLASQCGHANIVGLLLAAKANPDIFCKGNVALHVASLIGHSNVVDSLLKANANPDSQGMDGCTPLILACKNGHFGVVDLLLKANSNPNLSMHNGLTPLFAASHYGHSDIVRILLDTNADPNLQHPASGLTALMHASFSGCLESVELLLISGANSSMLNLKGLSALHLAALKGHEDIVHLIQAVELSQSSSNSPVLTTNEIASNVSNESLSILNESMETMLVAESEALISTHFKNFDKTLFPKHIQETPLTL